MPRRRKRRAPGSGYTAQAPNTTWSAFFPKFGGGYHVRKGFHTRSDAEAWLDALGAQQKSKVDVGSGQQKVGATIDAWATRAARERAWKAKTIADVQWKLGYVKPYIGEMALADVLPDQVDAMLDELAGALAETTVRQIRNYLFQVFEGAVKRRYILYNPVIKPERHKRTKQRAPERLSAPMAAALLRGADGSFYALAFWIVICCGLRAGEVCGLRRADVDLAGAVLHIEQEYTDLRGTAHQDTPKGDKTRTVPFPRALIPMLAAHLATLRRRQQQLTWHDHGLLFPGRSGYPLNPTSLRHTLHDLTDAAQLPPITTHMLRHTCGGLLTSVGCPENVIAAILGHAPATITRHYAPPDAETMRAWIEQVYGLIAGEARRTQQTGT